MMSKPSSTNYPNGFLFSHYLIFFVSSYTGCARLKRMRKQVLLGGYSGEVPPLPIPNREVKLTGADGTASLCGRVGNRLFKPGCRQTARLSYFLLCPACRSVVNLRGSLEGSPQSKITSCRGANRGPDLRRGHLPLLTTAACAATFAANEHSGR